MEHQGRKILTGTVTGYLSTGRMVPPRTTARRKTYYREAVRLTRAAGRRLREFHRSLRDAFPPAGVPGSVRFPGPATFHVGATLGPAEVTWPIA